MIERYRKDPKLNNIYVKRCKCGARPYSDRMLFPSYTLYWIQCNYCNKSSVSDISLKKTISNWNNDKLTY